ncbi:MAG: helix-turn-helix domain-containing protein [Ruminococcaceae bacterium]|nr:helix-turn-helix domain-containing protein [Oscillospiraceae bacterium]
MEKHHFRLCYLEPRIRLTALCSAYAGIHPVGYFYDGESHDFWEAVFVLKGRAGVTAGEKIYSLNAGQMIFHPPGEFHRLWNEGEDYLRIAIISFAVDKFPIEKHTICTFNSKEKVFFTVREIRKHFKTNGIFVVEVLSKEHTSAAQKAIGKIEELFLELWDSCEKEENESANNVNKDRLSELYSVAVAVMKNNIGERLSAADIASACGMSVSTMQKLFFRYTGIGMMKYYEGVRMQHARMLLNNGRSVKEVALTLGYSDQNYFSTAYKRYFGASPQKSIPHK